MTALLRLLQLTSPTLPIGAFAYSQGLEAVVHAAVIHDEASAREYLTGVLHDGFARVDLPYLGRLHAAFLRHDSRDAERWSAHLLASRESSERRLEDQQLGRALARLLADQGLAEAASWAVYPAITHAALFALAAARFELEAGALLAGFAFSWLENQVSALSRLVPLGQLAAQRVLTAVASGIPRAVELGAGLADTELGASLPGLALACSAHETQYTRLFKS
ncbi:MAG TPA: urease accessory UreF family protein [Polyangiaceae bacterium]|nr:urease accessory UreF family protein [Polyangiaceae bacterium]